MRLVLTPESIVLAEARRSYTTLSLYGYRVDGVVANRVFPADGADDWRAGWVLAQDDVLEQVEQSFRGLPIWRSVYRPREPVGVDALTGLAREVYGDADPLAPPAGDGPFRIRRTSYGSSAAPRAAPRDPGRRRPAPATATTWSSRWGRIVASSPCRPASPGSRSPEPRSGRGACR